MTQESLLGPAVWKVTDIQRLRRFLCLGSEHGVLAPEDAVLTKENASCVIRLINEGHGEEVVSEVVACSTEGRAIRQDPAIFALALCAKLSSEVKIKQIAYQALPEVCRTSTALFQFVAETQKLSEKSGWGRARRSAISTWYNGKTAAELALAVTKYRQRNGWSHLDLLRLAHVKPANEGVALVMKYVTKGIEKVKEDSATLPQELSGVLEYLCDVETVKHSHDEHQVSVLVEKHKLAWEHIPTWIRSSKTVWRSLLPHMPLTALLRQLGKLTQIGILAAADSDNMASLVIERLKNEEQLKSARIHPFQLLLAQKAYERGRGEKVKKAEWVPNQNIIEALNNAFCSAFGNVQATGKRYQLAIDVKGFNGTPLVSPSLAGAAMAMLLARAEGLNKVVLFADEVTEVDVNSAMSLTEIQEKFSEPKVSENHASRSVQWAVSQKRAVDVFILITNNLAKSEQTSPAAALHQYRAEMNQPQTKMVVCGLVSGSFTVADPDDAGMLDVAGFDANTAQIIQNFVLGSL